MNTQQISNHDELVAHLIDQMSSKDQFEAALSHFPHFHQRRMGGLRKLGLRQITKCIEQSKAQERKARSARGRDEWKDSNKWNRAERGVFEWLAVAYMFVYKRTSSDKKEEVVEFLKQLFPHKSSLLVRHTLRSMFKTQRSTKNTWESEAIELLATVVRTETAPISWLNVSMRFFEESNGRFFETAMTCREKWANYLNPEINKGAWSPQEELQLVRAVYEHGHSWTVIASLLGRSRTEHMVKNHFKNLVTNEVAPSIKRNESAAIQYLLRKKQLSVSKLGQEHALELEKEGGKQQIEIKESVEMYDEEVGQGKTEEVEPTNSLSEDQDLENEKYLEVDDIFGYLSDAKKSLDTMIAIEKKTREPVEPVSFLQELSFDYQGTEWSLSSDY